MRGWSLLPPRLWPHQLGDRFLDLHGLVAGMDSRALGAVGLAEGAWDIRSRL